MTSAVEYTLAPELLKISTLVEQRPEGFGLGDAEIQAAALNAAKFIFDWSLQSEEVSRPHVLGLLHSLSPSEAPQTRSQAQANGKRKRSHSPANSRLDFKRTPLSSLFTEGLDDEQIWNQLDLRTKNVCDMLEMALEGEVDEVDEVDGGSGDEDGELGRALRALESGEEEDEDEDEDSEDASLDEESGSGEENEAEEEELSGDDGNLGEAVTELKDSSSDEDEDDTSKLLLPNAARTTRRKSKKGYPSDLNDGFFDLAAFNAETERAEAKSSSRGTLGDGEESDDESVDLFAPVDDVDNFDEEDLENNYGEAYYKDFFEAPRSTSKPPPKQGADGKQEKSKGVRFHEEVRVRNIKAKGKNLPLSIDLDEEDEDEDDGDGDKDGDEGNEDEGEDEVELKDDMEGVSSGDDMDKDDDGDEGVNSRNTIERLKDDLFAEESHPPTDLSTHEKRMAALREQIAELESENVGQKDWVLMGEAGSRNRPQNSLLEEDLEFERVMKAVPVITEETVQGLEERIKTRILEGRFDDVARLRPMDDKPFLPSRFFELKDTKSARSLAEIYAEEYTGARADGTTGDDRDGKLQKEHSGISQMWDFICGKLDALCNAHYTPKQPLATISTVANVSTATLESALPTTKSVSTILAPEEVFAPSPVALRARSELTPAEKQALRTKLRKAKKKTRDTLDKSVDKYARAKGIGGIKKQKQAALQSVVKNGRGVTVVGKKNKDVMAKKSRPRT